MRSPVLLAAASAEMSLLAASTSAPLFVRHRTNEGPIQPEVVESSGAKVRLTLRLEGRDGPTPGAS